MVVGEFEPDNIEALIKQSSPNTARASLNRLGFGDYLWYTKDMLPEQAERKQLTEILSGFEHVEYQVGKEIADLEDKQQVNQILLVEGIVQPVSNGIQTWRMHKNGKFYVKSKLYKTPMARYEAWLISMSRAGVVVWRTNDWQHTAEALVHFEKSAQVESTAMHRYLKIKPAFRPNPYMEQVMAVADVGPTIAEALLELYHTPWDIWRQTAESLAEYTPGVGIAKARDILTKIGRKDV